MPAVMAVLFSDTTEPLGEPEVRLATYTVALAEPNELSAILAEQSAVHSVRSAVLTEPSAIHSALLDKTKAVWLTSANETVGFSE